MFMGELLGALTVLALLALGIYLAGKAPAKNNQQQSTQEKTIRCPTCGSPATLRGSSWECGWCGDFGNFSRK